MYVCECARRGQRSTLGISLSHSPPCLLTQGPSLNLELSDSATLAASKPKDLPVTHASAGIIGTSLHLALRKPWALGI